MRRGWIPARALLATACSPNGGDATLLDVGRDDAAAESSCDRADCEARCRAAGYDTGTCRTNGSGACSGYFYNPSCCLSLGGCCQNCGYDRALSIDASIGNCDGVTAPCP
jgi:hypothetical protein